MFWFRVLGFRVFRLGGRQLDQLGNIAQFFGRQFFGQQRIIGCPHHELCSARSAGFAADDRAVHLYRPILVTLEFDHERRSHLERLIVQKAHAPHRNIAHPSPPPGCCPSPFVRGKRSPDAQRGHADVCAVRNPPHPPAVEARMRLLSLHRSLPEFPQTTPPDHSATAHIRFIALNSKRPPRSEKLSRPSRLRSIPFIPIEAAHDESMARIGPPADLSLSSNHDQADRPNRKVSRVRPAAI